MIFKYDYKDAVFIYLGVLKGFDITTAGLPFKIELDRDAWEAANVLPFIYEKFTPIHRGTRGMSHGFERIEGAPTGVRGVYVMYMAKQYVIWYRWDELRTDDIDPILWRDYMLLGIFEDLSIHTPADTDLGAFEFRRPSEVRSHIVITLGWASSMYWLNVTREFINQDTMKVEYAKSLLTLFQHPFYKKGGVGSIPKKGAR